MALLASLDKHSGNDELKDATEDKQHAHEHPNVKEGDVGNSRNILTHLWRKICCKKCLHNILTELNIAVRVRRVVIPIPTLPGTDSAEINRDSQASILTMIMMIMMMMMMMMNVHISRMGAIYSEQIFWS